MADENIEEVGARLTLKDRKRFSSEADRAAKDIDKITKAAERARKEEEKASKAAARTRREQHAAGVAGLRGNLSSVANGVAASAGFGLAAARGVSLLGAGFTAAAAGASLFGLKASSAFEQSNIAFDVLLGSQAKANKMVADLQQFAKETPFEFADVQTGAQRLLAMGFAGDEVLKTMRTLGDAASSGIGPPAQMIERLTYAFGQIKATGRVQSDELRQLYEAGIPGIKILAEGFGVTTEKMQEMVTDGIVPADKAIGILLKGIDKKMGGLTTRQAKTLGGMVSNLKDAARFGSAKAFRPLSDQLKYYLPGATLLTTRSLERLGVVLERGTKWWERNRYEVGLLRSAYQSGGFDAVVRNLDLQTKSGGRLNEMWKQAKSIGSDAATVWKKELWPALKDVGEILGGKGGLLTPLGAAREVLGWMADHPDAGKRIFEGIAIVIVSTNLGRLISNVALAVWGLNAAIAANPVGLAITAITGLTIGLGLLYRAMNPDRPWWEAAIAATMPFLGLLLTVKNHLRDIAEFLGIIEKKKPAVYGPWPAGQSPSELQQRKNTTLKKTLPTGPFPTLGIPAMASGGVTRRAGSVVVGERAPELLTLPRGARVDPLPDGGGSLGSSIVIHPGAISVVTSDPDRAATLVVEKIQDMAARK